LRNETITDLGRFLCVHASPVYNTFYSNKLIIADKRPHVNLSGGTRSDPTILSDRTFGCSAFSNEFVADVCHDNPRVMSLTMKLNLFAHPEAVCRYGRLGENCGVGTANMTACGLTAVEEACPICAQQPHENCVDMYGKCVPTHACRFEDAAEMSDPTNNDPEVVKEAIDAAAEELI
jgi:hypothetical protein